MTNTLIVDLGTFLIKMILFNNIVENDEIKTNIVKIEMVESNNATESLICKRFKETYERMKLYGIDEVVFVSPFDIDGNVIIFPNEERITDKKIRSQILETINNDGNLNRFGLIDWVIQENDDSIEKDYMSIIATAIKDKDFSFIRNLMDSCGIKNAIITNRVMAYREAFRSYGEDDVIHLVCDIGHSSTSCSLVRNSRILSYLQYDKGGSEIFRAYYDEQKRIDVSNIKSKSKKEYYNQFTSLNYNTLQYGNSAKKIQEIAENIMKAINECINVYNEYPYDITIVGGGANLDIEQVVEIIIYKEKKDQERFKLLRTFYDKSYNYSEPIVKYSLKSKSPLSKEDIKGFDEAIENSELKLVKFNLGNYNLIPESILNYLAVSIWINSSIQRGKNLKSYNTNENQIIDFSMCKSKGLSTIVQKMEILSKRLNFIYKFIVLFCFAWLIFTYCFNLIVKDYYVETDNQKKKMQTNLTNLENKRIELENQLVTLKSEGSLELEDVYNIGTLYENVIKYSVNGTYIKSFGTEDGKLFVVKGYSSSRVNCSSFATTLTYVFEQSVLQSIVETQDAFGTVIYEYTIYCSGLKEVD